MLIFANAEYQEYKSAAYLNALLVAQQQKVCVLQVIAGYIGAKAAKDASKNWSHNGPKSESIKLKSPKPRMKGKSVKDQESPHPNSEVDVDLHRVLRTVSDRF